MNIIYLSTLLLVLGITFFFQRKKQITLFSNSQQYIVFTLFFFFIGILWDYLMTLLNVWTYNEENMIGVSLGKMPIEEILFSLVIPYFVITFYVHFTKGRN